MSCHRCGSPFHEGHSCPIEETNRIMREQQAQIAKQMKETIQRERDRKRREEEDNKRRKQREEQEQHQKRQREEDTQRELIKKQEEERKRREEEANRHKKFLESLTPEERAAYEKQAAEEAALKKAAYEKAAAEQAVIAKARQESEQAFILGTITLPFNVIWNWPHSIIKGIINNLGINDNKGVRAGLILTSFYVSGVGIYAANEIHKTNQTEKYPAISVYRDDGYGFYGAKNSDHAAAASLALKECSPGFHDGRYLGCHPIAAITAGTKACIAVARANNPNGGYLSEKITDISEESFSKILAKCESDPHLNHKTTCPVIYTEYFCNDDAMQTRIESRAKEIIAEGQQTQREEAIKRYASAPDVRKTVERYAIAAQGVKIHSSESRNSAVVAALNGQSCVTVTIKDGLIGNFLKVSTVAGGKNVTGYVWAYDVDIQPANAPKPQACLG